MHTPPVASRLDALGAREIVKRVGRPLKLIGCRSRDLRIRFRSMSGRTRGFYARWRPRAQVWECQLSGYGLKARKWFEPSQSMALANLRHIECLWDWKREVIDTRVQWEGVYDHGLFAGRVVDHCELEGDAPQAVAA